jgi:hypothetical protein
MHVRVDVPALIEYIACINSMQYTIRAIPPVIDRVLRQRAREEDKSLNAVIIETIARGLEMSAKPLEHTDLDALIGTWQEDPGFNQAMADFERIDEETWK